MLNIPLGEKLKFETPRLGNSLGMAEVMESSCLSVWGPNLCEMKTDLSLVAFLCALKR